jgi:CubicO group peptidase (beta-lactamase class C family)
MTALLRCILVGLSLVASSQSWAMDEADALDVGLSPAAMTHLDASMKALVETGRRSGVVWAISKNGKLINHKAIGLRDMENSLPMQKDTLFRLHSMTRAVTAVAVLIMHEDGKFDLDDPVSNYIPAFAQTPVLKSRKGDPTDTEPQKTPLTIRHLLTYTSGLGYPFDYDPSLGIDVGFKNTLAPDLTIEEGVDFLASKPLLFQPGTHWYYGFSSDVLGRLVEIWSGQPYDVFLRDRIFEPLGLNDMGFQVADDQWHRVAKIYAPGEEGGLIDATAGAPLSNNYPAGSKIFSGGGGLVSTAIDYLRFGQMLLNGGELDGVRILKPETVALMTRNHLTPEQGALNWYAQGRFTDQDPWTRFDGYGWGLSIGVRIDDQAHTVGGGLGEFKWDGFANTTFFVDPENDIVAVAMTQYLGPGQDDLEMAVRTSLYGGLLD